MPTYLLKTEPTEYSCEMEQVDDDWMRDVEAEVGERVARLFRRLIRGRM